MIGHPEEAALVRAAKGGDREAFAALVVHYQRPLYAFCLRLLGKKEDAEDTVQDAVVKALVGIHGLKNDEAFGGWLFWQGVEARDEGWTRPPGVFGFDEDRRCGGGGDVERVARAGCVRGRGQRSGYDGRGFWQGWLRG